MTREIVLSWILLAVMVVIVVVALVWLTQPVDVEGEIIGKEESQKAFLSGSPPMLLVNLTDGDPVLVRVSTTEFHQYEVGDWFNDTRARGEVGSGIDNLNMVKPFLTVLPLLFVLVLFYTAMGGRYR